VPRPTLLLVTGLPGSGKTRVAEAVAHDLRAAVVGHDWVMAALRAQPELWETMQTFDRVRFRTVGWSIMWNIAAAQLRAGRSVILDGVARQPEVSRTRDVAKSCDAFLFVVLCTIDDADLHKQRIDERIRAIPGWPELTWLDVQRSRDGWQPPTDVDLFLAAHESFDANLAAARAAIGLDSSSGR
jgi:predicted kinase